MKKFVLLFFTLSLFFSGNAQPWLEGVDDDNLTFFEIQEHFEAYLEKANRDRKTRTSGEFKLPSGYNQYKRWEYFWEARLAGTDGVFPNPVEVANTAISAAASALGQNLGAWTPVGPFNSPGTGDGGIGRLNSVTFHPTNQNIVWAGAPAGGLWKSIDGGLNWTTNTDQLPNLGVAALAIDPLHPDTMYMATGDRVVNSGVPNCYTYGVLKSTDGGNTWNTTGLTFAVQQQLRIGSVHIISNSTQQVLAATRQGIYKSANGGTTWTLKQPGPFNIIVASQAQPEVLYAGTSGSQGTVWRSKNSGETWTQLVGTLPTSGVNRVELATSPQDSNYVYAVYSQSGSSNFGGLYQSTDGGDSWTLKSSTPNLLGSNVDGSSQTGQGWYDLAITVSPTNKNQVFVGGVNVWRSNNQGAGWICVGSGYSSAVPYVHPDIHFFAWQPNTNHLFVASDGGIDKTSNLGNSWTHLYNGMNITQYYKISNSETDYSLFLAGAQDNGTHRQMGQNWEHVYGGDGMDNAINPANNLIMFASSQNGNFGRSFNGGYSFGYMSSLPAQGSGNWVTPIQLDPVTPSTVYIGYSQLWKSTNNGNTWSATSPNIAIGNIDVFAIAPSNNQIIYIAINNDFYRSTNGGATWSAQQISGSSSITGITVSSVNANHVWVSRSGYGNGSKVFESTNGGTTWTNVSGSLPSLPANCIIYENGSLNGVYVGTDVGVYYRDATMSDWTPYFNGLPNLMVFDLEINYSEGTLIAGTHARGIWKTPLISSFLGKPVANFTANPLAICTTADTITLTDQSEFGPNSWHWSIYPNTFTYVNGTSDSSQNPQVIFNTKGQYSVTLTASNYYGSSTKTRAKIIAVGGQPLPFVEDFEDASYLEKWQTENPDNGKTWEIALVGGSQPGNKAISMNFYNYSAIGQLDGFVSPPLNLEGFGNINLTFDHAYLKYNTAKNDSLKVYISTNCGTSWTLLQAFGENGSTNWVTGANSTTVFVPSLATDWCGATGTASCKTINLNAYTGNDEVRIKFVAKNDFGNNLYLDNINITGTPTVKPVANFIGDTTGCTIGSFGFYDVSANNPTSFAWSFPGGTPATSTLANPTVSYATGGNKSVTLIATNAAGADTIEQTAFITVNQAVTPSVSIAASATTICDQQLLTLTPTATNAGGNPVYFWYKNGNFKVLNNGPLSIYDAQNGDVYKCVLRPDLDCVTNDSVVSNSVAITVLPLPTVTLSSFAQVCTSTPAFTLTGGLPVGGTYSGNGVSNGIFNPQVAGVGGHVITYTVTSANGCINQANKNISVENGPPKPSITYSNFVLKASPISSSYTYQWFSQGMAIAGATDTIYTPWVVGNYTVKLTFVNGCESESDAFNVTQVGIDEQTLSNGLRLYPNPVKDVLFAEIATQSETELTLRIFDLAGREVYKAVKIVPDDSENLTIPVENLPAGTYILEVADDKNVLTNRFIKQ